VDPFDAARTSARVARLLKLLKALKAISDWRLPPITLEKRLSGMLCDATLISLDPETVEYVDRVLSFYQGPGPKSAPRAAAAPARPAIVFATEVRLSTATGSSLESKRPIEGPSETPKRKERHPDQRRRP